MQLGLGTLASNSELIVMRSVGVSFVGELSRWVIRSALIFGGALICLKRMDYSLYQ